MFVFWQNVREDGEQQYTVMGLSVHPDYRRKGYAKEEYNFGEFPYVDLIDHHPVPRRVL